MKKSDRTPELLAPAGSLEAFFAALEKGADAVYCGLKDYSARAKAKNFTLSQMEQMLGYAHGRGKKIYVTINTLIKEQELPHLVETLSALDSMGSDGVIIQDLGVARIVRRHFPGLPLHASTQMTIHNSLAVAELARLGFQRVVTARELHLDELRQITAASPLEIECFVHGALCFSISGQCYFSSFLGGHSGNRGRCAQPCRRLYHHRGKEGYFFSTNDFSAIDLVPELTAAGVASFKIEGRMKSAEYVACVVEAYRTVMDAPNDRQEAALREAKELLKRSYGRPPTRGFLASHSPTDIAIPSVKGSTGRFLGVITAVRGGKVYFTTKDRIHIGDRLRIQPKTDMAGKGFTVKELSSGNRSVKVLEAGASAVVVPPFSCQAGDSLFKVSSETAFTLSEAACRKRLESEPPRVPCDLQCAWGDGELAITAAIHGESLTIAYPLGELEASRTDDMAAVLTRQMEKCGDTPFFLRSLKAPEFPSLLIPANRFKEIRRDLYARLAEALLPRLEKHRQASLKAALADISLQSRPPHKSPARVTLRIEQFRDWSVLHQEGIHAVSLPVSRANMHQLPQFFHRVKGKEEQIHWRLPFMLFEKDIPWFREALAELSRRGFTRFIASNLGHFPLLKEINAAVRTDYRLFSLNTQALLQWQELGADSATLYIEDDAHNLAALLAAPLDIGRSMLLYTAVPLITSKIAIKEIKRDAPVTSDRGDAYTVAEKDGLSILSADSPFCLTGYRGELAARGCSSFELDLTAAERDSWTRIIAACAAGRPLPQTSTFNYLSELV